MTHHNATLRGPERRRRDPQATRDRLVRAALELFTTKGYHGSTTPQIAAAAGVAEGTIYRHFQSKEHLLVVLQIRVYNRLVRRIHDAIEARPKGGFPGFSTLDAFFQVLGNIDDVPVQAELWNRAVSNERIRENLLSLRQHLHTLLESAIDGIMARAKRSLPLAVPTLTDVLLGTLMGLGLQAMVDRSKERVECLRHLNKMAGNPISFTYSPTSRAHR